MALAIFWGVGGIEQSAHPKDRQRLLPTLQKIMVVAVVLVVFRALSLPGRWANQGQRGTTGATKTKTVLRGIGVKLGSCATGADSCAAGADSVPKAF